MTPWPPQHQMRWSSRQTSLLRFNCADSLDRTNAASYFAAVQVPEPRAHCSGHQVHCAPARQASRDKFSRLSERSSMQALVEQSRRIGLVLEGPGLAQRAAVRSLQGHGGNLLHTTAAASHSATGMGEEAAAPDTSSGRPVGEQILAHLLLLAKSGAEAGLTASPMGRYS